MVVGLALVLVEVVVVVVGTLRRSEAIGSVRFKTESSITGELVTVVVCGLELGVEKGSGVLVGDGATVVGAKVTGERVVELLSGSELELTALVAISCWIFMIFSYKSLSKASLSCALAACDASTMVAFGGASLDTSKLASLVVVGGGAELLSITDIF